MDSDTESFIRGIHTNLNYDKYFGDGGWWPDVNSTNAVFDPIYGWCIEAPGLVQFGPDGAGDHTATGSKVWDVGFDELVSALSYVHELELSGKDWTVVLDNCTDEAIIVGNEAEISTISYTGPTTPEDLSDWLNEN